jgi:hypothetical protein
MILLLYFFLSNLNKLGFEEPRIVHGANSIVACDVGALICLNV